MAAMRKPGIGSPMADPDGVPEWVVAGIRNQTRAYRIQHDVARDIEQSGMFSHCVIMESVLPHSAGSTVESIDGPGDGRLHPKHASRKVVGASKPDQSVPVIGHQNPREQQRFLPQHGIGQCTTRNAGRAKVRKSKLSIERSRGQEIVATRFARSCEPKQPGLWPGPHLPSVGQSRSRAE